MVQSMVPAGASDPDGEDGHAAHTGEGERRARALAQARGRRRVGEPECGYSRARVSGFGFGFGFGLGLALPPHLRPVMNWKGRVLISLPGNQVISR